MSRARKAPKKTQRVSRVRKALKRALQIVAGYFALILFLIPIYEFVPPPVTSVMLLKALGGDGIHKNWTSIDEISPLLVRAVLVAEDERFCEHWGIDWTALDQAINEERDRPRGASTITMQMVKNLFFWTNRSYVRKVLELPLSLYAELFLSKRRIMEIYLNTVQWDTGIYGAHAAAEHYFRTTPKNLSAAQAVRLAAVLPAPERRNAAGGDAFLIAQAQRIAVRAMRSGAYAGCVLN